MTFVLKLTDYLGSPCVVSRNTHLQGADARAQNRSSPQGHYALAGIVTSSKDWSPLCPSLLLHPLTHLHVGNLRLFSPLTSWGQIRKKSSGR